MSKTKLLMVPPKPHQPAGLLISINAFPSSQLPWPKPWINSWLLSLSHIPYTHSMLPSRPFALAVPLVSLHFPQTSTWLTPSSPLSFYSKYTSTVRPSLMAFFKVETPPQHSLPLPWFIFLHSTFHHWTYYLFHLIYLATLSPNWYVPSGVQVLPVFFLYCFLPNGENMADI